MKNKGFTLLEILIAMAFMTVAMLGMFSMNQMSNRGSMDAYYEFLAFSLAREPIEVYRNFGYDYLKSLTTGHTALKFYPIGKRSIKQDVGVPGYLIDYPAEAAMFDREIILKPITILSGAKDINAIKITVIVSTANLDGKSKAQAWLSRQQVKLESIVVEQPN